MINDPHSLRDLVADTERKLVEYKAQLDDVVRRCQHTWGKTTYEPRQVKSHIIPGSEAGSDFLPEITVPAKTFKRWKRVCIKCELTQITEKTKPVGLPGFFVPLIPDFGD